MLTRLFDEDPELLWEAGVPEPDASRLAQDLIVEVKLVQQGPWKPAQTLANERHLGALILKGFLIREESAIGAVALELFGKGDLLCLSQRGGWQPASHDPLWCALTPVRLAVLDRDFQEAISSWPGLHLALLHRVSDNHRSTVVRLALMRKHPLASRLHALFYLLADRWGYRRNGATEIPLRLSHALLAGLVGAERSSVTRAIQELQRGGLVERRARDCWVVLGTPPTTPPLKRHFATCPRGPDWSLIPRQTRDERRASS